MQTHNNESRATKIGNKAANLEILQAIAKTHGTQLNIAVPPILSLTHSDVKSHLDKHAKNWPDLWNAFVKAQGDNKKEITESAKKILAEIRALITNAFEKVTFPLKDDFLKDQKNSKLMVRSTGKEDTLELANPGGNESISAVKPEPDAISKAMGQVVASYFSEKSLMQRLLGNDDIRDAPFMPVLLQQMIAEKSQMATPKNTVRSGVMYTGEYSTRIQLAPGHGELIVNSRAPFDTYYVSRENVVRSEINHKTHRIISVESEEGREQKLVKNSVLLSDLPSVNEDVALRIAETGRLIEKYYGMPMDVEFVYDPSHDMIYLVQARPIPNGHAKALSPSSIPPSKLEDVRKNSTAKKSKVITSAGDAVRVITKPDELLVCRTIEDALTQYMNLAKSGVQIHGVIVGQFAPATSHEAAQFNAMSIPVMQVDDLDELSKWVKEGKPLILDPQRKQVIQWHGKEKTSEELFSAGILQEGLFKSSMPAQETITPVFPKLKSSIDVSKTFDEKAMNVEEKIGDLIQLVDSDFPKTAKAAVEKILPRLFLLLPKKTKPLKYTALLKHLEIVEAGNDKSLASLQSILGEFYRLAKEHGNASPYNKLFKRAMIVGAEIAVVLEKRTKEEKDQSLQREYLGLVGRLEALITDPGSPQLASDSIRQIYTRKKESSLADSKESKALPKEQQAIYIELTKLGKIALNTKLKEQWNTFALACCQELKSANELAALVTLAMQNNIDAEWLHICFANSVTGEEKEEKKHNHTARSTLTALTTEMDQLEREFQSIELNAKQAKILAWEQRIGEWSDPKKFQSLWSEYEKDMTYLIQSLTLTNIKMPLAQKAVLKTVQYLADVMDKTIKSLKGSPEYQHDKKLQVTRFAKLLEPYFELMWKWMDAIPSNQRKAWVHLRVNAKNVIMETIKSEFEKLKSSDSPSQLLPGSLSIPSVKVGTAANFSKQWHSYKDGGDGGQITLENLFSLMHQNIITCTGMLGEETRIPWAQMPNELVKLCKKIEEKKVMYLFSLNYTYPKVTFEYNFPMNNHSIKFDIRYNMLTKKSTVTLEAFGHSSQHRMKWLAQTVRMDAKKLNAIILQEPEFEGSGESLSGCMELPNANSLEELADIIPDYGKILDGISDNVTRRYQDLSDDELCQLLLADDVERYAMVLSEVLANKEQFSPALIQAMIAKSKRHNKSYLEILSLHEHDMIHKSAIRNTDIIIKVILKNNSEMIGREDVPPKLMTHASMSRDTKLAEDIRKLKSSKKQEKLKFFPTLFGMLNMQYINHYLDKYPEQIKEFAYSLIYHKDKNEHPYQKNNDVNAIINHPKFVFPEKPLVEVTAFIHPDVQKPLDHKGKLAHLIKTITSDKTLYETALKKGFNPNITIIDDNGNVIHTPSVSLEKKEEKTQHKEIKSDVRNKPTQLEKKIEIPTVKKILQNTTTLLTKEMKQDESVLDLIKKQNAIMESLQQTIRAFVIDKKDIDTSYAAFEKLRAHFNEQEANFNKLNFNSVIVNSVNEMNYLKKVSAKQKSHFNKLAMQLFYKERDIRADFFERAGSLIKQQSKNIAYLDSGERKIINEVKAYLLASKNASTEEKSYAKLSSAIKKFSLPSLKKSREDLLLLEGIFKKNEAKIHRGALMEGGDEASQQLALDYFTALSKEINNPAQIEAKFILANYYMNARSTSFKNTKLALRQLDEIKYAHPEAKKQYELYMANFDLFKDVTSVVSEMDKQSNTVMISIKKRVESKEQKEEKIPVATGNDITGFLKQVAQPLFENNNNGVSMDSIRNLIIYGQKIFKQNDKNRPLKLAAVVALLHYMTKMYLLDKSISDVKAEQVTDDKAIQKILLAEKELITLSKALKIEPAQHYTDAQATRPRR